MGGRNAKFKDMENGIWKHETSLLSCNIQTWHLWIHGATAATPFQRVARRPGCQATAWKPAQVSTRLDEILKSEILSASPRCCEKQWGSSLSGNWSHCARTAQDSYRDKSWLVDCKHHLASNDHSNISTAHKHTNYEWLKAPSPSQTSCAARFPDRYAAWKPPWFRTSNGQLHWRELLQRE